MSDRGVCARAPVVYDLMELIRLRLVKPDFPDLTWFLMEQKFATCRGFLNEFPFHDKSCGSLIWNKEVPGCFVYIPFKRH